MGEEAKVFWGESDGQAGGWLGGGHGYGGNKCSYVVASKVCSSTLKIPLRVFNSQ